MSSEIRNCQNCKTDFGLEPEDFSFYEKMHVPAPTWCSDCRMVRRMLWRNERSLYHRTCAATGKKVISCFSPESGVTVYDRDYWWSDAWDASVFGEKFDNTKPFFLQFSELLKRVPLPNLFNGRSVGSSYSNHVGEMKNAYLSFACWISEDVYYSAKIGQSKECMDCLSMAHSDLCYDCVSVNRSSRLFFSKNCENCIDSWFLYDCVACTNCFGCANLRNKSYCIFNEQYSREDYFKKLESLNLSSMQSLGALKKEAHSFWEKAIHRYASMKQSYSSTGNNLSETNNCKSCFDVYDNVSDCKYCINGIGKMNDTYDGYGPGLGELMYEVVDSGDRAQNLLSTIVTWNCVRAAYCYNCHGCSDIFGCIGLRDKKYCILNVQYTKEEYEELLPFVKKQMNEMPYVDMNERSFGFGDFFPPELSPFCYNETIAHEYFPHSKEEVLSFGYKWKENEEKDHVVTIEGDMLPDCLVDVDESILEKVIGCLNKGNPRTKCTSAFKFIPEELNFYKRFNLPLPQLCPNCRFYNRMALSNPPKLWSRRCMCKHIDHDHSESCLNEFETSYAPERPETVYCESCYQKEVI